MNIEQIKGEFKHKLMLDVNHCFDKFYQLLNVHSRHYNDIVLLKGRYQRVFDDFNKGIIQRSEREETIDKIQYSIISLIDKLEITDFNSMRQEFYTKDTNKLSVNIEQLLYLSATRMTSWDEIYLRAVKLVENAQSKIYATAFGIGEWKGKIEYLEAIAKNIKNQRENKIDVIHKVVFGRRNPKGKLEYITKRKQVFEKYNVLDHLRICEFEEDWGIDFLIVDDKDLHLSFQSLINRSLILGIEILDSPEFVIPISQWYDNFIFENANPIKLSQI